MFSAVISIFEGMGRFIGSCLLGAATVAALVYVKSTTASAVMLGLFTFFLFGAQFIGLLLGAAVGAAAFVFVAPALVAVAAGIAAFLVAMRS